jgi:hypothetical protein
MVPCDCDRVGPHRILRADFGAGHVISILICGDDHVLAAFVDAAGAEPRHQRLITGEPLTRVYSMPAT